LKIYSFDCQSGNPAGRSRRDTNFWIPCKNLNLSLLSEPQKAWQVFCTQTRQLILLYGLPIASNGICYTFPFRDIDWPVKNAPPLKGEDKLHLQHQGPLTEAGNYASVPSHRLRRQAFANTKQSNGG
jgi:hypothetical protein